MKKILLTTLIIFSSLLNAQYIKVTPNGYVLGDGDNGLIIDIPNKTASELYTNTLDFINKNYNNPDDKVFAKTENKYIRFTTIDYKIFPIKTILGDSWVSGYTTYEIDFKDNKIRVYSINPYMYRGDYTNSYDFKCGLFNSIYTCKGQLKKEAAKNHVVENIEAYYNNFFNALKIHLSEKNNDW